MGAGASSGIDSGDNRVAVKGLADRLELDRDQLLALQKQFAELAKKEGNPNSINRMEFEEALKLVGIVEADQTILQKVFTIFDRAGDNNMTFMEFIVGVSTFINGTITERLNFSFQLYDLANNGMVSRDEMSTVLRSMHSTSSFFGDATLTAAQIEELVSQIFTESNLSEDGQLSYTEYMNEVAKHPVLVDFLARLQASEMSEDAVGGGGGERRKSIVVADEVLVDSTDAKPTTDLGDKAEIPADAGGGHATAPAPTAANVESGNVDPATAVEGEKATQPAKLAGGGGVGN